MSAVLKKVKKPRRASRVSYSIRCHKGLLHDLHKCAEHNRRSVNAEIVLRLENSLIHRGA